MLRAILIDDEQAGLDALKLLIEQHTGRVKVVATTTDAKTGIALIEDYKPELVFLDISMPEMSGFELLRKLCYRDFKLIFTTAHEEYAIQAIRNHAYDYLLKPIDVGELKECIAKITDEPGQQEAQTRSLPGIIELSVKNGIFFIKPRDIIRLEASGSYTVFYLVNEVRHVASKSLKEYEAMLDPRLFYRCHNSHIVNLAYVTRMISQDGFFAQMCDGSMAEIARKSKDTFLEKLKSVNF